MTEKETKLYEKLLPLHLEHHEYTDIKNNFLLLKNQNLKNFKLSINAILSNFLDKVLKNEDYFYLYNEKKEKYYVYRTNSQSNQELILSLFWVYHPKNLNSPLENNPQLKFQPYLTFTNFNLESELDKLRILGKVSSLFLNLKLKLISKFQSLYLKHYKIDKKILKKYLKIQFKLDKCYSKIENVYYPHFLEDLKKGITLNPLPSTKYPSFPLLNFGIFNNISKLKLLKDNTLFVTTIENGESDDKLEYKYHLKIEDLENFIKTVFILPDFFLSVQTPSFYCSHTKKLYSED